MLMYQLLKCLSETCSCVETPLSTSFSDWISHNVITDADFIKGWHLCQLEVLECKKVPWPNSLTEDKYCVEDCGWSSKDIAYECKINLLTGRTHQVLFVLFDFFAVPFMIGNH